MMFWKGVVLVSAVMLLSLIFVSAGIAILVFLIRRPLRKYKYIDLAVFDWLQTRTSPRRNRFMLFITLLGKHQFLVPANLFLIIYFLFISSYSWFSIRDAAIALSSLGLMLLLKNLFRRKRPLAPLLNAVKGLSFPSGHAIMAVTFYGFIIYILFHTVSNDVVKYFLTALLVILIGLVGFSRVYLRVHYLSDVLAGFIIGLLWLFVSIAVLNRVEDFIKEKNLSIPSVSRATQATG
ncbi:MAG: phosphatase PAP2 family protein [Ferruginibacter sp.]|nr:phosphatase PAP2 family protein [Chitinophagaceae bacterium]